MRHMLALTILALLLAGCGGDFASPTATDYETTTTTTTTTAAADMTQTHNRPVCVGLLNIGSCNTVQTNVQQMPGKPHGSPAPQPTGPTGAEMIGTAVLLCVAFIFCMALAGAVMGSGGYN